MLRSDPKTEASFAAAMGYLSLLRQITQYLLLYLKLWFGEQCCGIASILRPKKHWDKCVSSRASHLNPQSLLFSVCRTQAWSPGAMCRGSSSGLTIAHLCHDTH